MQTPCIRICSIDHDSQLCTGCGRTLDEIAGWSCYDDETRRRLMEQLPARLEALTKAPEAKAE